MEVDDIEGDTQVPGEGQSPAYRALPPHPPIDDGQLRQGQHAAELAAPDPPPSRHNRVRMVTGGVLTLASLVVSVGLVWWAIGRGDQAEGAFAIGDPLPAEAADAPGSDSEVLPGGADQEFFADPDGFLDRFRNQFPDDFGGGLLGGDDPFHLPDGEFGFTFPDGRFEDGIGGRFGRLQEELDSLGIPSLDLVIPDDAIVRGLSFSSVGEGTDRTLGLTVTFELDGVRSRLTAFSSGELGAGTEVDLDGTAAIIDDQGRLVWKAGGGPITFTLDSQGLDQAGLVDLAIEIERAMR